MEGLQELARQSRMSLEDMVRLHEALLRTGYMTPERALQALRWFTVDLGIDAYYFRTMPVEDIITYCASCSKAMFIGGKRPHYLVDLLFGEETVPKTYLPAQWHKEVDDFIETHR